MGVPAVEVSVIPLMKRLPNILNIPLISGFVRNAINAGTAEYVAPKSMTLNLEEILLGNAIGGESSTECPVIPVSSHQSKSDRV